MVSYKKLIYDLMYRRGLDYSIFEIVFKFLSMEEC